MSCCLSFPLKNLIIISKNFQEILNFCIVFIVPQLLWINSYHSINSQDLPMILLLQELRKILELDLENSHSHWNFWFILFFSIILQYKFFYLDNQRRFLEHRSVNLNLLILICVWMFMKNYNNESPCHHLKIWILYLPFTYFSHFFLDFVLSFLLAKQLNYGW